MKTPEEVFTEAGVDLGPGDPRHVGIFCFDDLMRVANHLTGQHNAEMEEAIEQLSKSVETCQRWKVLHDRTEEQLQKSLKLNEEMRLMIDSMKEAQ